MRVRAIIGFRDRKNGLRLRKKGAVFDVDEERAEKLLSLGYVARVGEITGSKRRTRDDQM